MSKRFLITIEEDEWGDPLVHLPTEVYETLDWTVGDVIQYDINDDSVSFKKTDEV